ncbi:hypothetical protein AVW09_13910 [Microbacterium sp. T32]|nr:hypothetical protein AVW09_13910 [Microbacterium sp. T32]
MTPYAIFVTVNAMIPAVSGAISAGRITLLSTTPVSIAEAPTPTSVAPMRPPKRACDELEGRPSSHVSMFHVIAPMRPAKMIGGKMSGLSWSSRIMPPEIVFATSVDRKAPTRLRLAASSTATLGFSAPVAMGVAIALAVSWNPLVKSKNSARTMTSTMTRAALSTDRFP